MAKRKKVKVDNKTYNINSPEYKKLYSEGIMSVDTEGIPNYYSPEEATVTAKRINRGEEAVRKGRAKLATPIFDSFGVYDIVDIAKDPMGHLNAVSNLLQNTGNYNSLGILGPAMSLYNTNPEDFEKLTNIVNAAGTIDPGAIKLLKPLTKGLSKIKNLSKISKLDNLPLPDIKKIEKLNKRSKNLSIPDKVITTKNKEDIADNPFTSSPVNESQYKTYLKEDFDKNLLASKINEYQTKYPGVKNKYLQYLVLRDPEILKLSNRSTNTNLETLYVDAVDDLKKKGLYYPKDLQNIRSTGKAFKGYEPELDDVNKVTLRDIYNSTGEVPTQKLNTNFNTKQLLAIDRYSRGFDDLINDYYRSNKNRGPSQDPKDIASGFSSNPAIIQKSLVEDSNILLDAIKQNKFVDDTQLSRGIRPFKAQIKQADGSIVEKMYPTDLVEGDEFLEKGFMSTATYSTPGADDIIINAPGGNKQSFLYLNSVPEASHYINESEALLPPGLNLKHSGKFKTKGDKNIPIFDITNPYMQTGVIGTGVAGTALSQLPQEEKALGGEVNPPKKSKGYRLPTGEYVSEAVTVTAPKMSAYEKRVKAAGKRSKDYRNMGSQIVEGVGMIPGLWGRDTLVENLLEGLPYIGQPLSIDDAIEASSDLLKNNEQGYINNTLDILGVTNAFKYGKIKTPQLDNLVNYLKTSGKVPKGLNAIADIAKYSPTLTTSGVTTYGVGKDLIQDENIPQKANGGNINPTDPEDKEVAMRGMMKARMALDSHFGNPSAKRMTSLNPQEYTFTGNEYDYDWGQAVGVPAGETGTHFMAAMGNYAVPFIQQGTNSLFFNERASSKDKEAMKFETPEEAQYFSENYKNIAPMMYDKKALGGKITNNMKKKKNKNLPIDNGLPKAMWGLEMLLPLLGNIGTGVGAASGAASGLAGAGGGGLGSLGAGAAGGLGTATGAGAGLQSLGSTAAGSVKGSTGGASAFGGASKGMQSMNPLGPLANATMQAVNNMIKSFEPEEEIRPVLRNTGAHYANGGKINIKPSKRGTFTAAATKRGKGVQEFARQVLANKDNYSPAMVKKANFARNAAKWKKAMGGLVEPEIFEMSGLTGTYMDAFDAMALGGVTNGDPTFPPLRATASDSANVYKSAVEFENKMKNLGYQKQGTFDMFDAYNQFVNTDEFGLANGRLKVKSPDKKLEQVKLTGTAAAKYPNKQVKDVGEFYSNKKIDDYKYNVAELLSPMGYNTDLPYQVLDERIAPQGAAKYILSNPLNPKAEDAAIMLNYDPIAVKPYAMRTPEEQAEYEKKYGKPQPAVNVTPRSNVVPVSDIRPSAKSYFEKYRKEGDPTQADRDEALYRKILRSGVVTGEEAVNLGVPGVLQRFGSQKAMGGMIDPLMAFGGMIDPSMYMEQMMYGSYAGGGQVPQNIPVEVEGEEMYELPDGQTGEFQGPKHENGGIPIALPEGTKIYSDRLKVNGKTMAQRKEKRDNNIKKLEKLLTKNPSDRFIKEALKRQSETATLEEQGDMQMQEQANQQQAMQEQMMEEMLMGAAQQDIQQGMMAMGGMIKRADGSYSKRGLWDNIRANRGSGKRPTKEMLKQEKKIRAAEKAYSGLVQYDNGTSPYGVATTNFFNPNQYNAPIVPTMEMNLDNYENALNTMGSIYQDVPFELRTTDPSPIFTYNNDPLNPITMDQRSYTIPTSNYNPTFETNVPVPGEETFPTDLGSPLKNVRPINATIGTVEESLPSNYTSEKRDRSGFDLSDIFGIFGGDKKDKTSKTSGTSKSTTGDNVRYTEGDRMGMMGNLMGMFGPSAMTMLNRLETPKNKNFFREFGQEALRTQMEAEGIAGMAKDEAYRKNLMKANALRKQLANAARGVGDIRTQQLAAALSEQEGARDILGSYLQGMSGLKGQRAQLQQQIDQTRMGGEYQRDLADRQDIDQFYTNLAENLATASEFTQKQGKDMNTALRNKDILSLSKYYSAYGIYADYDDNGNLVLKDDSTGKKMSVEEANKKKKEMDEKAKKETGTTTTSTTAPETTGLPGLDLYNKFGYINQPIKLKGSTDFQTKRKR